MNGVENRQDVKKILSKGYTFNRIPSPSDQLTNCLYRSSPRKYTLLTSTSESEFEQYIKGVPLEPASTFSHWRGGPTRYTAGDTTGNTARAGLTRIIHLLLDEFVELLVIQPLQVFLSVEITSLRSTDDLASDNNGNFTNSAEIRVQPPFRFFLVVDGLGKSSGRGVDHVLGDMGGLAEDSSESDTREDIHIVALTGDVLNAVVGVGWEWRAGGKDDLSVGPLHGLLECAFGLVDRVGETNRGYN